MNLLDFVVIIAVISQILKWLHFGFARRIFSVAGFWIGLIGGATLSPLIITYVNDPLNKLLVALVIILGTATFMGAVGRRVGEYAARLLHSVRLAKVDILAGSIFNASMTLLIAWLLASMISGTPFIELNRQVRGSAIIQSMNRHLPPAPHVISRITSLINPHDFPQVFIGPEPRPIEPVSPPSSAEIAAALEAAGKSTVRLESLGCGGVIYGSGFVAESGLVVTNAHVVAGIDRPTIVDAAGSHRADVIYFDPDKDIAVLRTRGLAGPTLSLQSSISSRGTTATTLGYPGGGPLNAVAAGVLEQSEARGRDIYGRGVVSRSIYTLQTHVEPGNSGGPLVLADGTVIGIIFARSESEPETGYALTSPEIINALNRALAQQQPVDTGSCAPA